MILPRTLMGKSSIQYLDPADAAKPRVQQYRIFADAPRTPVSSTSEASSVLSRPSA